MKNGAVLTLAVVLCFCNPCWAKMDYQPECAPTLFDVLLDIVTAPCSLLAACVGLDENSRCVAPTKIKKVAVTKKIVEASPPVERTQKVQSKVPVEKIKSEIPQQPATVPVPLAQEPATVKPLAIEQFSASEKPVAKPLPAVEPPGPEVIQQKLPPEQPQPVTATMPAPAPLPMDRPSSDRFDKPLAEIVQPKAPTVADVPESLPKPQISPPKVEQKSTQDVKEEPRKEKSQTGTKKSSGNRGCYPSVPYYQTYPSCGPRFFFR